MARYGIACVSTIWTCVKNIYIADMSCRREICFIASQFACRSSRYVTHNMTHSIHFNGNMCVCTRIERKRKTDKIKIAKCMLFTNNK